ncbi:MAG: hypothetical protein DLM72_03420 [Candidatus Nitrosopolaris wilkensis]|nr:MAG: hypothetical protein DLM72_03420 [Candidatus Nitrosopolaris wilkensis]
MGCNSRNVKSLFKEIWTGKVLDDAISSFGKRYYSNHLMDSLSSIIEFDFRSESNFLYNDGLWQHTSVWLSFAFMTISKGIEKRMHAKINEYLGISALGVALVFVSFFANPSAGSYLPFGVLSASFFAFGAYLFFSGIYSSAVSIGSDSGLSQSIRKSAIQQSKLLDSIGTAHMEQNI